MAKFSHINAKGQAQMVDVGGKKITRRTARASATLKMNQKTLQLIKDFKLEKGDVYAAARLAGIMAAKRTSSLIPLTHPLPLNFVDIKIEPKGKDKIEIKSTVKVTSRTGAEMEALVAVVVAGLTIYDMVKAVDRKVTIVDVHLLEKMGGKSGKFIYEQE
jgi:cyclic pyranopterin phosphate synthase